MHRHLFALLFVGAAGAFGSGIGCGDDSGGGGVHEGPPGGPAEGPADTHCQGKPVQPTDPAFCMMGEGGAGGGAGGGGGEEEGPEEYGATMNGTSGDDDECKYHITWSSTDIYADTDVTFTVVLTDKEDGRPATGAETLVEAFLNDIHPAPNAPTKTTEGPDGTYEIGPVRFDASGTWTVRFHFYDDCLELSEKTPHGHGAFYVEVP